MNQIKIFSIAEKQKIERKLNEQFGIKRIKGLIIKTGSERLFIYQGKLNPKEIINLERLRINLERTGIYFAKETNNEIRLSIEGVHIFKDQITKNIFELNAEQLEQWMKGNELNISSGLKGFVVMKYKNDFVGTGKASAEKITNFIPKNRRLKEKN
jgi:NOL1/NOP2/fmu family ribosome biogenesis protein